VTLGGFGILPSLPALPNTPFGSFPATRMGSLPGSHSSTILSRGLNYRNPNDRSFVITVDADMLNLPTLPQRMDDHMQKALIFHLQDAAEKVIVTAQQSLVPGHGYDTGRMHDSLIYALAEHLLETGVFYDLFSEEAYYWRYVEFGHWTRGGNFWPGYHFLENSLRLHEATIRTSVRAAWHDTAIALAAEARAPWAGAIGSLGGAIT